MNWQAVQGWCTESSLVRRAAEALCRAVGRRHLARFDQLAPARCQTRILLGLLHQAQTTRFGRDHDFRRIRTVADFRRLVPLCTRADLWRQYAQPVYSHGAGARQSDNQTSAEDQGCGDEKQDPFLAPCLPVSLSACLGLDAAHRHALRTALALVSHCRPRGRLLVGDLLFVGEEGPSNRMERNQRIPALVRPFARVGSDTEAERWAFRPVSCLVGSVERLLPLLETVKQIRGKACLMDVWPGLTAILYMRRSAAAPLDRLRAEAEGVLLVEMASRAEGPIAVEDPRHGLLRLLFDHGVFFEFVPPGRAGELRCPRYGIDEIEMGVPYELALTSPAGLWACRIGRTVCLEGRDPPLLRFLDTAVPQPTPVVEEPLPRRTELIRPMLTAPASHPQIDGSPAAPPGSSFHSPWSILADRG